MNDNNDYSRYSPYLNTYQHVNYCCTLISVQLQLNKLLKHSFIGFVFPET